MLDVLLLQEVAAKEAAFYAGLTRQRQEEAAAKRKKGTGTMTMRERQVPSIPSRSRLVTADVYIPGMQKTYRECMHEAHFLVTLFGKLISA